MKKRLFLLLFLATSVIALAQQPPESEDPIARHVFPPELVMAHQSQLGLSDNQRATIKSEIHKAQSKFLDLQWQLQSESEKLVQILQGRPVDEAKVLAQVESVLNLEREIKKTHMSLLVRIKNLLSEEQQTKLLELRRKTQR